MLRALAALVLLSGTVATQNNLKVVRAARMLDVKTGRYLQNPTIVIAGDRIKEIEFGGKTIVDEAHRVGKKVAAHAVGDLSTRTAV